jgi:murein DD-endopeptidase MepM/ murein hydrolase activator NlpD
VAIKADQLRLRRKGDTSPPQHDEPGRGSGWTDAPAGSRGGDRAQRTWSLRRLPALALLTFILFAWLAAATVGYVTQRGLVQRATDQNERLEQAYADLQAQTMRSAADLRLRIDALESSNAEQAREVHRLTELQDQTAAQLAASERSLRAAIEQRDRAWREVQDLEAAIATSEASLANTRALLVQVGDERDAGRLAEAALRWQLANFQTQLERLGAQKALAQSWLKGWVIGNVETLEELVAGTGVDLEALVARAATTEVGQGGPLEAMDETSHQEVALADPADPVAGGIQRLTALQKLASTLPLASPLDQFRITSTFGKRQDPFTRGWAFHSGLDLGAAAGSKILATAPGTVVVAGRSGPYGNMVEIDHGMGVTTRYGHLKSVAVKVGDQVAFRQNIGVIGTTGRSTSLHLHYEVLVDGEAYDPSRFLDAGRYLVGIFDSGSTAAKAPDPKS